MIKGQTVVWSHLQIWTLLLLLVGCNQKLSDRPPKPENPKPQSTSSVVAFSDSKDSSNSEAPSKKVENRYKGKTDIELVQELLRLQEAELPASRWGKISTRKHPEMISEMARRVGACKRLLDSNSLLSIYPLSENEYIVLFQCYFTTYQPGNEVYLLETDSKRNKITAYGLSVVYRQKHLRSLQVGKKADTLVGYVSWNEQLRTLRIRTRPQGAGTCVNETIYRLIDRSFDIEEYRADTNCRDDKWLLERIYPSPS
jgi:hypothetical protein